MSVEALTWAFKAPLPPTLKLVLLSYADRADEDASCRPAVADTMRRTGLSDRAIRTANLELERLGMIRVEAHYTETRRQTANRYYLSIDATPAPRAEAETGAGEEVDATPAPDATPEADAGGEDAPDAASPCTTCSPDPAPDAGGTLHHVQTNRTVRKEPSKEITPPTPRKRGAADDPAFEAFYAAYPRHDAPDDALKAWRQVTKAGADPAAIMAGLAAYQFNPNPQYVKLPASWLRAGCWKTPPPAAPRSVPKPDSDNENWLRF